MFESGVKGWKRDGFAVDLSRALFCGLLRRDRRMAIFVCGADESSDQNPRVNFFYGGYSASAEEWDGPLLEAWDERVLKGPPRIPYLHMTSILSPEWRAQYGMSLCDAHRRLDHASWIIQSQGSLIPVMTFLDQRDYDAFVRQPFHPYPDKPWKLEPLDPDYICFLNFALAQLHWIHDARPDAERVDFYVEQNGKITKYLKGFHGSIEHHLRDSLDLPELADLVGHLIPIPKDRIQAQTADILAWHARNNERGTLDRDGERRYRRLAASPGTTSGRYGVRSEVTLEMLQQLGELFTKRREGSLPDDEEDEE